MAEKTMKLKIEGEGFEPLYKNLNKVNDKTKDIVYSCKEVGEAFKSALAPASQRLKTLDELMTTSVKHILPDMEKINQLNKKMVKEDLATNALKMKNVQVEIAGLDTKKTAITKYYEEYDKEEKKILEKGRKRQKEQLKDIDNLIFAYKAAGKDITDLEASRAEFVKNSDQAILDAVKKNNEKRKEAVTVAVKETMSSIKQMYEQQKALIIEAGELEKQKARTTYDAAIEQAKTDEERVALEKAKAERIEAINTDMNNKLAENTKTQLVATTTFVDDAIKEITAKVAENKKNGGITDIVMTKENIAAAKAQLEEYKSMLNESQNAAQLHFAILENQYKDDASMLKLIQTEKVNAMAMYAAEIAKIDKTITETSKKENGLQVQQIKDFVEVSKNSYKELTEKNKKFKEEFGKASGEVLKFLENDLKLFETNTQKYDDEMKKLDEEQASISKNRESYSNELKMLRYKEADSSKQMTDYEIEQLKKLEQAEKDNLAKETQIAKDKDKAENEKKKAEKNKKRVELSKKIIEATADVAAAVTKALTAGPFIGQAMAAIYAAYGAVQVAIMTKQLAKLEDGGLLNGKRHSQGGMRIEGSNIEVEGGEYVVNRESTSKNLGLVRYINSERRELKPSDLDAYFNSLPRGEVGGTSFSRMFADGGQLPVVEPNSSIDNEALIYAIKNIRIEPRVAVTDIHKAQDSMVSVDSWTGV